MAFSRQVRVLHYRNMCIRKHHWIPALFEILIPVVTVGLMTWGVTKDDQTFHLEFQDTIYEAISDDELISRLASKKIDLIYAPDNNVTKNIVRQMLTVIKSKVSDSNISVKGVENELEIVDRFVEIYGTDYRDQVPAFGLYFPNIESATVELPEKVEVVIRPVSERYDTNARMGVLRPRSLRGDANYLSHGFLSVQAALNLAIQQLTLPNNTDLPKVYVGKFPFPKSIYDVSIIDVFFGFLSSSIILSMSLIFLFVVKNVISEKETGAKELQKLMGLKSWMTWIGWLMGVLMTQLISITIIVIFLTFPVFGRKMLKSSPILLWAYLMLYVLVAVCFSFAICPIFKRPTIGVCVAIIAWLASGYRSKTPRGSGSGIFEYILFLFPNVSFVRGLESFHCFDLGGDGADWSDFFSQPVDYSCYPLAVCFGSFILQCIILSFITWYLDTVFPGPFGIPESPFFFLKKSYWIKTRAPKDFAGKDWNPESNKNFGPAPRDLKPGIQIRNLKKSFKHYTAVNNLSINFYQGEITALLGHNGAGKTTTMSMITGMIPADSGKIIVDDFNIFDNISKFRENLGLCPQHNLLFNYLNVTEHLIFFGLLKGLSKKQAKAEVLRLTDLLNISNKKKTMADKLSGGMKRKLSLSMALIGNPKILILDEPTSGMDPESRREMWDLLLTIRGNHTIILTTHFMEEADVLGDRIAIMDHGEVLCFGTSIMLKKLYGEGYYLNILKKKNFTQNQNQITSVIQEFILEARLKSDEGPKLCYILPMETVDVFPATFTKLESMKDELGISSLGVACTTLEEVFLKVGAIAAEARGVVDEDGASSQENYSHLNPDGGLDSLNITVHSPSVFQQFSALLKKKILYSFRRGVLYLIFGIVPILASILTSIASSNTLESSPSPPLKLDSSIYDFMRILIRANDSNPYTARVNDLIKPQMARRIDVEDIDNYLLKQAVQLRGDFYANNLMALSINDTAIVALYNQVALHSMPIALNLAYNFILKTTENRVVSAKVYPIGMRADIMESCSSNESMRTGILLRYIILWIQFFSVPLLVFTGSVIAFPIGERLNSAKQLQLMTGVSPFFYWLTTFIVDYSYFILVSFLCVLIFILGGNLYVESALVLCVILMVYGAATILFAYVVSYFKKSYASSYTLYLSINIFIGTLGAITVYILQKVNEIRKEEIVDKFWLRLVDSTVQFLPQYSFSVLLRCLLEVDFSNRHCETCPTNPESDQTPCTMKSYFVFSEDDKAGLNNYLITLALSISLCLAIMIFTEKGWHEQISRFMFNKIHGQHYHDNSPPIEDPDVREEKDKVNSILNSGRSQNQRENASDYGLLVDSLVKKFSRHNAAVRGISFAVKPGECFGLLGVNGAGKTTTFRMITGDTLPTSGDCSISNYFLYRSRQKYLSMIGYCPQFDGINEYLTGYEMLQTFAMLRGIPRKMINQQINKWISTLGLQEYKHNLCGTYSGGNKRKLNAAMALIADPGLVILDEPTSGVDTISRRKLWTVLIESRRRGQALVLTSHSMDECEILCDRLTIMVAGKMKCLGNVEYLKQRYAQGYSVIVQLRNAQESDRRKLKRMVSETFEQGVKLDDEHAGLLKYHISESTVQLSELFSKMQNIRENMNTVEDYQISNTTLEEVFLSFARSEPRVIET